MSGFIPVVKKRRWGVILFVFVCLIFLIVARINTTYAVGPNGMSGSGLATDPYIVNSCADLQAIGENLTANYALGSDINCSDHSSGIGFQPIGLNSDGTLNGTFTGVLDGNKHTISNLTINQSSLSGDGHVGLFAITASASVHDLIVDNATITGQNASGSIGGIIATDANSVITRVSFSGSVTGLCQVGRNNIGGIVGRVASNTTTIANSSSSGTILETGSGCGENSYFVGGMIGYGENGPNVLLTNDYSAMDISLATSSVACSGSCGQAVGGLLGYSESGGNQIENSYTSGTLSISGNSTSSSDAAVWIGGLAGAYRSPSTMINNFTATTISSPTCSGGAYCVTGAVIGDNLTGVNMGLSSNYFDNLLMPTLSCGNSANDCNSISTSNYFYNNSSNPPMNNWDFTNIWQTSVDLPQLIQSSDLHPSSPQNLNAVPVSGSEIDLTWDAPATLNGTLAHYEVAYQVDGDTSWSLANTTGSTSLNVTGLSGATTYNFRVSAVLDNGYWSAPANVQNITTNEPQPDQPRNLGASVVSPTEIDLSWNAPMHTGDSAIDHYTVDYQKDGAAGWTHVADPTGTTQAVTGLTQGTTYNFRVIAVNVNGHESTAATVQSVTQIAGFTLINSCTDLQNMNNDLTHNYQLAHDIDCSDTSSWNGGAGFIPIGPCTPSGTAYSGIFEGSNYTISNLYIDQTSGGCYAGLFSSTNGALLQDVRLSNPTVKGALGASVVSCAASLSAITTDTPVKNVQVTGAHISASGGSNTFVGGLIAYVEAAEDVSLSKNSFEGSIQISGGTAGVIYSGGMYGFVGANSPSAISISNNYTDATTVISSAVSDGSFMIYGGFAGELVALGNNIDISNSYSTGSFNETGAATTGTRLAVVGGVTAALYDSTSSGNIQINNSFSHLDVLNLGTNPSSNFFGGIYAYDASPSGAAVTTIASDYFDAILAGTTQCAAIAITTNCHTISSQPNYFYNNHNNPPLDSWDFDNIWLTTSTLPIFGKKVTSTITPIAPERLNIQNSSQTKSSSGVVMEPPQLPTPTVTNVTQSRGGRATTSSPTTKEEGGILNRIKQFIKAIPPQVLITFPYVLFGLLLAGITGLLIQMWLTTRHIHEVNVLIADQKRVAEERDNFWHLAANYLRAPVTLIMGGADLIATRQTAKGVEISNLARNLQVKVANIMRSIEQSTTLKNITWPQLKPARSVVRSLRFWLPLLFVGVLVVVADIIAYNFRHISTNYIAIATQVMIFMLSGLFLYWVLNGLGILSRKRRQAEAVLAQQSNSLDFARRNLITTTAEDLDIEVARMESLLKTLPQNDKALPILSEGARRLRHIVDSFQLLINAQNHNLSTISPLSASTGLAKTLNDVLAELQTEISAKNLTVNMPNDLPAVVPGSTKLTNQVLSSVLANAVAFSPANGQIKVEVNHKVTSTAIIVRDKGSGISQDQMNHIFQPFTKADGLDALQLDHGGLGINLYLDREIMSYLGGKIEVASELGKGTTVSITWPVTRESNPGSLVIAGTAGAGA